MRAGKSNDHVHPSVRLSEYFSAFNLDDLSPISSRWYARYSSSPCTSSTPSNYGLCWEPSTGHFRPFRLEDRYSRIPALDVMAVAKVANGNVLFGGP